MPPFNPDQIFEREQRRVQRLMDPKSYTPQFSNQRRSTPRPSDGFELQEDTRQSLLEGIADKTTGALYRFANVLDLPGSTARDIVSTVTGTPRNPFDQWLSPTTDRGRIYGRDLLRQWDMISPRDNWGNFLGGVATDIALDPLTYLGGLGATRGAALTKHGQLLEKSGLLNKLPRYMSEQGMKRARNAQSTFGRMGPREAMQQIKHADDIIRELPTESARRTAREALENTAESLGYKKTIQNMDPETLLQKAGEHGSAYKAFLDKEGQEALAGSMRFGLPNWRIFGASPKNQLRQSPHMILGSPGSEKQIARAAKWDALGRSIGETTPMRYLKGLLHPKTGGFTSEIGQQMAPSFKEGEYAAKLSAHRDSTDIVNNFKWAFGDDWKRLNSKLPSDERLKLHNMIRNAMEGVSGLPEDKQNVARQVMRAMGQRIDEAKDLGVAIDVLDDDFTEFFPRQLSAAVQNEAFENLESMSTRPMQGLPTNAFTQHEISRLGALRDIKGGEGTLNEIWTDSAAYNIKQSTSLTDEQKVQQITKRITEEFGNRFDQKYRGASLNQADMSRVPANRRAQLQEMLSEVRRTDFSDIMNSDMDWQAQREAIDRQLRAMNIRTDTNWVTGGPKNKQIDPSSIFDPQTRLWELKENRARELAEMYMKSPDKAHEVGLFGNFPLYDLEQYLQRMDDVVNRGTFTMSMLRHPKAIHASARGGQPGPTLRQTLQDLSFDPDVALEKLADAHGINLSGTATAKANRLHQFGKSRITQELSKDIQRYQELFESPESANYFVNMLDSIQQVFKVNVTSPWPAFHLRNLFTGQLRNMVDGTFSLGSVKDSYNMLRGGEIDASSIPAVQNRWKSIQHQYPHLQNKELTSKQANEILAGLARENDLIGPYALVPGHHATSEVRTMGGTEGGHVVGEGTAQHFRTTMPGEHGWSLRHAAESYFGLPHKMKAPDEAGKLQDITTEASTTTPLIGVTPFPTFDLPLWLGRKGIGKTGRKMGSEHPTIKRWADEKFLHAPNEWKVREAKESLGAGGLQSRKYQDIAGERLYGPAKGGEEFGFFAEGMNRLSPWLHQLRQGVDPAEAAQRAVSAQIDYSAKNFTPFERQVLKRAIPFYSFTSRSLPWAARKFYEEPHNLLSQVIRTTKKAGSQLQEEHHEVGPVPSYIRDTLAIPMTERQPGTKRYFTGLDLMSQDLWQLLMPIVSGQPQEAMHEIAARSNPALIKYPIETLTGTSLWQRGVEGGRPLRTMSPPIGRTLANIGQSWEQATGNQFKPGYVEHLTRGFGPLERIAASSPYSRMLSSVRKLTDIRKSPTDKALSLGLGAGITDVSPRQQESILREYLSSEITDKGGYVFSKATFPKKTLREMTPENRLEALRLKALNDERARVAKELKERARRGMPGY